MAVYDSHTLFMSEKWFKLPLHNFYSHFITDKQIIVPLMNIDIWFKHFKIECWCVSSDISRGFITLSRIVNRLEYPFQQIMDFLDLFDNTNLRATFLDKKWIVVFSSPSHKRKNAFRLNLKIKMDFRVHFMNKNDVSLSCTHEIYIVGPCEEQNWIFVPTSHQNELWSAFRQKPRILAYKKTIHFLDPSNSKMNYRFRSSTYCIFVPISTKKILSPSMRATKSEYTVPTKMNLASTIKSRPLKWNKRHVNEHSEHSPDSYKHAKWMCHFHARKLSIRAHVNERWTFLPFKTARDGFLVIF